MLFPLSTEAVSVDLNQLNSPAEVRACDPRYYSSLKTITFIDYGMELPDLWRTIAPDYSHSVSVLCEIVNDCRFELGSYLQLADGWDGYRGRSFDRKVISRVISLVETIEKFFQIEHMVPDEITPCPLGNGGVDLEVALGSRTAFFQFDAVLDKVNVTRREGQIYLEDVQVLDRKAVESHLRWLAG